MQAMWTCDLDATVVSSASEGMLVVPSQAV